MPATSTVIDPAVLTTVPAFVDVENIGRLTAGMTVVDTSGRSGAPNCDVAMDVDVARFRTLLDTRLSRLDAAISASTLDGNRPAGPDSTAVLNV